jgi:hypothetical protein
MRAGFERSGGFMGRKIQFSVDLDELPEDQAGALKKLIEQADFFNLPEDLVTRPKPDEFTYLITVETETASHMVRCSDTGMTDSLRPLLHELILRARSGMKKP